MYTDSIQLKGIKQILGVMTTFMKRGNTNQAVYEKAVEEVNRRAKDCEKRVEVIKLSEYYDSKRKELVE